MKKTWFVLTVLVLMAALATPALAAPDPVQGIGPNQAATATPGRR